MDLCSSPEFLIRPMQSAAWIALGIYQKRSQVCSKTTKSDCNFINTNTRPSRNIPKAMAAQYVVGFLTAFFYLIAIFGLLILAFLPTSPPSARTCLAAARTSCLDGSG